MRIANGVYVLSIPRSPQEAESYLNLTLIVDGENGTTLVDAGLPDQTEAIGAALAKAGISARDLRHNFYPPGPPPCRVGGSPCASKRRTGASTFCGRALHRRKAKAAQTFARDARTTATHARGLGATRARCRRRAGRERYPPRPCRRGPGDLHAGTHKPLFGGIEGPGGRRRIDRRQRPSEWPKPVGHPRHAHSHAVRKKASRTGCRHCALLPRRRG
jgi:hypothetical protein